MTISNSLRIIPELHEHTVCVQEANQFAICSYGWIMKNCVPLMKWVVDATNAREMVSKADTLGPAGFDISSHNSDDGALSLFILELCMLELLGDELTSSEFQLNGADHHNSISSIQRDCADQYPLSVMVMFSNLLVSGNRVAQLNESAVDLLEYCMRKVLPVQSLYKETVEFFDRIRVPLSVQERIKSINLCNEDIAVSKLNFAFLCLGVLRYLVIHRDAAHVAMYRRLMQKYDIVGFLIGLVELRPWTRVDNTTNARLKFEAAGNLWVPYTDRLSLPEASVWIMLVSLILVGDVDYNLQAALSLRKFITTSLIDQIPQADDLRKYLEELHVMNTLGQSKPAQKMAPFAILDLQETMYEQLKRQKVLHTITPLTVQEEQECATALVGVYQRAFETSDFHFMRDHVPQVTGGGTCAVCGVRGALNRCSKCKQTTYCSRECQVKDWPKHRSRC